MAETVACPTCGASIPVEPMWFDWCDSCGWNADPDPPPAPTDTRSRDALETARAQAMAMFEEVSLTRDLRPRWSVALTMSYILALMVHLVGLAVLVLSLMWMRSVWPNPFAVAVASAGIFLAAGLRPRLGRIPKGSVVVARRSAPGLYDVLDEVAAALSGHRVDVVVLTADFNAGLATLGLRRRRMLSLGVPLWTTLGPSARVALLSHELAHDVNGDGQRRILPASALASLQEWYSMLTPGPLPLTAFGGGGNLMIGGGDSIAHGLMRMLARMVEGVWNLEMRFTLASHRRAEYLADDLAADIGGTDATVTMLETLLCRERVIEGLRKVATSGRGDLLAESGVRVSATPDREIRRMRRVSRLRMSRADGSHPPTALRIDLIEAGPRRPPLVTVSEADMRGIDAELAPMLERVVPAIATRYRGRI
jgi:Zn-dependent protease with chaperone function